MLDEENLYDEDEDENEEEGYAGFSIVDESGEEVKKPAKKEVDEQDTPTIATPIPQNEQTVIIDNAAVLLPQIGQELELHLSDTAAEVYFENEKIGDFKPAFVQKLQNERKNQYVSCLMHSNTAPVMVKLKFCDKSKHGYIKI